MVGVHSLGQLEDVDDGAHCLEMAIGAVATDKDGMIDVPVAKADIAEANVANLGLAEADVADIDVPTEMLHKINSKINGLPSQP